MNQGEFFRAFLETIASTIISKITEKALKPFKGKPQQIKETIISSNSLPVVNTPKSYKEEAAHRLRLSKSLLSSERQPIPISRLCEFLNLESVEVIENYFNGIQEPSFSFLEMYAKYYGLELEWLKHDVGHKFKTINLHPNDSYEYIAQCKPQVLYFVRNMLNGESGLVLQINDTQYISLSKTISISKHVSNTGVKHIKAFLEFIEKLQSLINTPVLRGVQLDDDAFIKLFAGEIYPKNAIEISRGGLHWWEDFLDYSHQNPYASNYIDWYGGDFVGAQRLI